MCQVNADWESDSREMLNWMNDQIDKQLLDDKLLWKTTYSHHYLFGMDYEDNFDMIKTILPILRRGKHDVFISGHYHFMTYTQIPPESELNEDYMPPKKEEKTWWNKLISDDFCAEDFEYWPQLGRSEGPREVAYLKGDKYHQVILGNAGRELDPYCVDNSSAGKSIWLNTI